VSTKFSVQVHIDDAGARPQAVYAMKRFHIFSISTLFFLAFAPAGYSSTIVLSSDICTTQNCNSQNGSYSGANAGTGLDSFGDGDDSGAIDKGTVGPGGPGLSNDYDTFDTYGAICTSIAGTDCDKNYASFLNGNSGSVSINALTQELTSGSNGFYRFVDTFTAGSQGFIGNVVFYGNIAWLNEGDTANSGCGSPASSLVVECNDTPGFDNRMAIGFLAGNDAWAATHISYELDGDTPTFIINLDLAPGQSISIAQFVLLAGTGTGPFVPNPAGALAEADYLQNNPDFSGLTTAQIDGIANFDTPEPGTFGLVSVCLAIGLFTLRRQRSLGRQ
jgi:hypothetical protein